MKEAGRPEACVDPLTGAVAEATWLSGRRARSLLINPGLVLAF